MGAESVDTGRNHKMPKICTGSNHKNTRDSNHETANMSADTGRNHKMPKKYALGVTTRTLEIVTMSLRQIWVQNLQILEGITRCQNMHRV